MRGLIPWARARGSHGRGWRPNATQHSREYRGKKIFCTVWRGVETPCATRTPYTDVFIGSVLSTIEMSEREQRLQVMPEDVFLGNATSRLTVNTQQGACLPAIQPGEKWLFYLYPDKNTGALVLAYRSLVSR